jgi:hypothetical protein
VNVPIFHNTQRIQRNPHVRQIGAEDFRPRGRDLLGASLPTSPRPDAAAGRTISQAGHRAH